MNREENAAVIDEIDGESPIKDYAAEALTYPRDAVSDHLDEYEHFGNRRLRTVGELIQANRDRRLRHGSAQAGCGGG